ncbi:MAG: hypothetical protein WCB15_19005 [Desulfobacterales bacterium]
MNKIQNLLKIGDLRTTGKSDEVVKLVLSKPPIFKEVVNAILTDDPGIRMRASDAAEKITRIHPEWLNPYKKLLLNEIAKIKQQEVRWHTAQMLPRLKLTKTERKRAFGLLLTYLEDKSRIVKTSTMQALADIAIQDNTYLNQVNRLLSSLIKEGSPAMKARGKKLLLTLKKIKDETKD